MSAPIQLDSLAEFHVINEMSRQISDPVGWARKHVAPDIGNQRQFLWDMKAELAEKVKIIVCGSHISLGFRFDHIRVEALADLLIIP